jgi:hypothetical protein
VGGARAVLAQGHRAERRFDDIVKKRRGSDEVPKALWALEEAGESDVGCPLEPQFEELYAVLGDQEAQDAIRAARTPTVAHCPMLRHNRRARTGCANNPHESPSRKAAIARLEPYQRLLECGYAFTSSASSAC